jgi:hypothetical protein
MTENKNKSQIKEFLDSIPDDLDILGDGIDMVIQKEYITFSQRIGSLNDQKTVLGEAKRLSSDDLPVEDKKRILVELAHLGTVESYRTIEKFLKCCDEELKGWTLLSLQECRMFLEGDLSDDKKGFISTGLGGKGDKLRYCFVIRSLNAMPFSEHQQAVIIEQFKFTCKSLNVELEAISFKENCLMAKVLVPMDVAVGEVIESGIKSANKISQCLKFHYYVSNVNIPTDEEISEYLREING